MRVIFIMTTVVFIFSITYTGVQEQNTGESVVDASALPVRENGIGKDKYYNYPNPFLPVAGIYFTLEKEDHVKN